MTGMEHTPLPVRGVVFDLDGTLCDTLNDITAALNVMLKARGCPTLDRAGTLQRINHGARNLVTLSLPEERRTEEEIDRCLQIYDAAYAADCCVLTTVFDGIPALVTELKARGVKMAVLSNKQHNLVTAITEKLLPGVFDVVMGQSEYPHKPDPAATLAICRRFGLSPEQCLFVGDSDVDVATGRNAGMETVGVTWGYRDEDCLRTAGADRIIRRPGELLSLLRG